MERGVGGDVTASVTGTWVLDTTGDLVGALEDVAEGAFLRGPRARPFVICVSCGPVSEASGMVVDVLMLTVRCDETRLVDRDVSLAVDGGPRASRPASAGLNRPASLLPIASFPWSRAEGLFSFCGTVAVSSIGAGIDNFGWESVLESDLPRAFLFARASGIGASWLPLLEDLATPLPSS